MVQFGELEAALSAYDEAARLGDSDAPDHQAPVAWTCSERVLDKSIWGVRKKLYTHVKRLKEDSVP